MVQKGQNKSVLRVFMFSYGVFTNVVHYNKSYFLYLNTAEHGPAMRNAEPNQKNRWLVSVFIDVNPCTKHQ